MEADPDQWVSPTEDLELTVVEVDMDMEGVKDDSYQYWDETHEIYPGGSILVGEMKSLELKQVLPLDITGTVKLDVIAGGPKIEIYGDPSGSPISLPATYNTPSGLPKTLNVKGIVASDDPCDIILRYRLEANGIPDFNDVIKLTVVEVDLDIFSVSDEDEEDPGGFVALNDDDDNQNGIPDKDEYDEDPPIESVIVDYEDDLVEITLKHEPSLLLDGYYIQLYTPNDGQFKISVFTEKEKGDLLIPDPHNSWAPYKIWPTGNHPTTLWVEGFNTGTAELWLSYMDPEGNPICEDKVKFTVIDVDLQYCYPHILMYTGNHADDTPKQNCVAIGSPSGGTFSWVCSTKQGGNGLLEIVKTQHSDPMSIVTVKGVQPSSVIDDAKITVSYTFGGKTATAVGYVTVHRPATTLAYAGYFDWQNRTKRYYFHRVFDQFTQPLNITGMPCDEVVRIIYGEKSETGPGNTAIWGAEKAPGYPWGNWPGGIAVKDVIGGNTTRTYDSKYEQDIYVGGEISGSALSIVNMASYSIRKGLDIMADYKTNLKRMQENILLF